MEADLDVQKKAAIRLNAEYATKIQGLLYSISEQNQSLMMTLRSAYIGFQTNPCEGDGFFLRHVESVNQGQYRLMELKAQIAGLIALAQAYPNSPEKLVPVYLEIVGKLGGSAFNEVVRAEIERNREIAKKWTGGNHE
ncbi:hypothetical protein [Puia dinghuensis]|uniref:Uncharacterized protein n=1 Tax=Puia dinghuensis TaxID=1792502 RepID=A0A8J2UHR1_9BACT|nr:hypothetical protein [Puia dinghuensis]GGB18613.1 hypothetical protein GCM10011511_48000 [Puia dinghuensis]